MAENFFGLLKTEFYYMNKFSSVEEFKKALVKYITYYNTVRIKMGSVHRRPYTHGAGGVF